MLVLFGFDRRRQEVARDISGFYGSRYSVMNESERYVTVNTTIDSEQGAARIARQAVEARLAACAQVLPIRSTYRWKGEVEQADEFLVLMKTKRELAGELSSLVRGLHTYEVPELVVTPILGGDSDYLEWIDTETVDEGAGADDG